MKREYRCPECGSVNVVRDAFAHWNAALQDYELCGILDAWACNDCGEEITPNEVAATD